MSRSNMFQYLESEFKSCKKEEISEKTIDAFTELIDAIRGKMADQIVFFMLTLGAKLGIASKNGELHAQEKALADEVFQPIWKGDRGTLYGLIGDKVSDKDYAAVQELTNLGNDIAIPLLKIILGFAYIGGKADEEVLNRLDGIFGKNLLAWFIQNGMDSVPVLEVTLENLEAEIVRWFRSNDQLRALKDIAIHFPTIAKEDVKKACDSLCEKGILFGGEHIGSCMYALL